MDSRAGDCSTGGGCPGGSSGNDLTNLTELWVRVKNEVEDNLGNDLKELRTTVTNEVVGSFGNGLSDLKDLWVLVGGHSGRRPGLEGFCLLVSCFSLPFPDPGLNLLRKALMRLMARAGIERRS